jgi:hypothetical protein
MSAMDALRTAGIEDIGLITQPVAQTGGAMSPAPAAGGK